MKSQTSALSQCTRQRVIDREDQVLQSIPWSKACLHFRSLVLFSCLLHERLVEQYTKELCYGAHDAHWAVICGQSNIPLLRDWCNTYFIPLRRYGSCCQQFEELAEGWQAGRPQMFNELEREL